MNSRIESEVDTIQSNIDLFQKEISFIKSKIKDLEVDKEIEMRAYDSQIKILKHDLHLRLSGLNEMQNRLKEKQEQLSEYHG